MKIIKIDNTQNILNEDYALGQGFNSNGFNNSGFSYAIMPLQFNLCQRGNDGQPTAKNKAFKHFVGDTVTGLSPYDNKKHKGIIKYLYYETGEETAPKLVYIHDFTENVILPITGDSVKRVPVPRPQMNRQMNYLLNNPVYVGRNLTNYAPSIKEQYDFNAKLKS